jgi:hypothetical protein
MNQEAIFEIWAPDSAVWSPWVKPVLFAHLDGLPSETPGGGAVAAAWAPAPESGTALILDLPGAEGIGQGLALAARGYRPVPLYNAVPGPDLTLDGALLVAVEVRPIMAALRDGAEKLAALPLAPAAPPAFLLDAHRRAEGRGIPAAAFDNRSICFTTDFPSANFLLARGIKRGWLVQRAGRQPQSDLAHTLRRWQEAGLPVELLTLDPPGPPAPLVIPRPAWYGAMFQRALAALGLRRAGGGGFGDWGPDSAGGG